MGWFSSKKEADDKLPTTAPAAGAAGAAKPDAPKRDGIFCGMSFVEFLIALVIFALFFFFVIYPLIMAYICLAVLWLVMWPCVRYIPACANHVYVKPVYTVLSVVVTSPIKVCRFLYRTFKGDKGAADGKPQDPMEAAASAAAQAAATSMMQQKA